MYEIVIKGFKSPEEAEQFANSGEKILKEMRSQAKTAPQKTTFDYQEISLFDIVRQKIYNENPNGYSIAHIKKDADPGVDLIYISTKEELEKHFTVSPGLVGYDLVPNDIIEAFESFIEFRIDEREYSFEFGNTYLFPPADDVEIKREGI